MVADEPRAQDLAAWLAARGPMDARSACDTVAAVCSVLQSGHDRGLSYGELHPGAVLLSDAGACRLVRAPPGGPPLGFVAPEQRVDGAVPSRAGDVFAAGALLAWLLTGQEVAALFGSDPDAEAVPGLPRALVGVVRRATAFQPTDRHPTAAALAAELHARVAALPEAPAAWGAASVQPEPWTPTPWERGVPSIYPHTPQPAERRGGGTGLPAPRRRAGPAPKRVPWLLAAPVAAVAVLAALVLGSGAVQVARAKAASESAEVALYSALDAQRVLLGALAEAGVDAGIPDAYAGLDAAAPGDRCAAARLLADRLELVGAAPDAGSVARRLEPVRRARAEHQRAVEEWRGAAEGWRGALAIQLGLAPPPGPC